MSSSAPPPSRLRRFGHWILDRHFDEWLFEWRSFFALLICIAGSGLLAMLLFTTLGQRWTLTHVAPIDLSDEVESLLAFGTLALAYAALVQAVSAVRSFRTPYVPGLELVCSTSPPEEDSEGPLESGRYLEMVNLGPGTARDVRIAWRNFATRELAESQFRSNAGLQISAERKVERIPYFRAGEKPKLIDWIADKGTNQLWYIIELHAQTVQGTEHLSRVILLTRKSVVPNNENIWQWEVLDRRWKWIRWRD